MPKRSKDKVATVGIDISFLPEDISAKVQDIFDQYFKLGLPKRGQVGLESTPEFPKELAALSSQDLGNLFGQYSACQTQVSEKLKYITAVKAVVSKEADIKLKEVMYGEYDAFPKNASLTLRRDSARLDPGYQVLERYLNRIEVIHEMLNQEFENYRRETTVLSREISRRENNAGF